MMRLLFLFTLAACGPVFTIYTKTSPQRVTVAKQATAPEVVLSGRFVGPGTVELAAKHASDVRVTRVVHYGAASFEGRRANPLIEIVEIPFGLLFLLIPPVWESPSVFHDTEGNKFAQNTNWLAAMISPFQTILVFSVRATPGSNADIFVAPPATREFHVNLPAPGIEVRYKALDDSEHALASGTATMDSFGRATVSEVAGAIAFEVTVGGKTTVIPVEPEAP